MIERVLSGAMHVLGDNIDTDQIYPGQYLDLTDHQEMAAHCLEGASSTFARDFREGDIVAAGRNFGCGSSRENAAIALKVRGVGCVIAKGYARIFYRNAINLGLPLIVCPRLDEIALQGGTLEIDLDRAVAANKETGHSVPIEPISEYAMRILDFGGIKPLMLQAEANR